MADIKDLTPALQRLDAHIDGLEEVLEPLLSDLQEISSQLPLLDKAKLFSLTAYAIESLLFCRKPFIHPSTSPDLARPPADTQTAALKLQGADAQNHAVFTELRRVQQYFAKIKAAEEPQEPQASRNLTVNQEAAARMLKSDLVSNCLLSRPKPSLPFHQPIYRSI